jgi:hypothetical protein
MAHVILPVLPEAAGAGPGPGLQAPGRGVIGGLTHYPAVNFLSAWFSIKI